MFKKVKQYIENNDNKIILGKTIIAIGVPASIGVMAYGLYKIVKK